MALDLTPVGLGGWLGETIADEADITRANSAISYATTIVFTHCEKTWATGDVPDEVAQVILSVASRGYANPEGWASERADDWYGGGRKVESEGMYLTATEKNTLRPFVASKVRGLGILSTYKDEAPAVSSLPAGYVPVDGGGAFRWYR